MGEERLYMHLWKGVATTTINIYILKRNNTKKKDYYTLAIGLIKNKIILLQFVDIMFKIIFTISYFCASTFKMNNLIKHLYYQISILSKASNSMADMQGIE